MRRNGFELALLGGQIFCPPSGVCISYRLPVRGGEARLKPIAIVNVGCRPAVRGELVIIISLVDIGSLEVINYLPRSSVISLILAGWLCSSLTTFFISLFNLLFCYFKLKVSGGFPATKINEREGGVALNG